MSFRRTEPSVEFRHDLAGSAVYLGLASFLVLDRSIPDLYILPVGFSLKVYHLAAGVTILLLAWAWSAEMRPLPKGAGGLLGLLTLLTATFGPFVNSPTMTSYQANAAELGLFTFVVFAGLFVAAHYVGQKGDHARTLLWIMIVLSAIQATIAGYERFTGWLLTRDTSFLTFGILVPDPSLVRGFVFGTSRIGGGFRPVATAPHPIVLSALCGTAVAVLVAMYPYVGRVHRRRLLLLVAPLAFALIALETRTGILVGVVSALVALAIVFTKKTDRVIPFMFSGGLLAAAALATFPSSARNVLNQFARLGSDPSVAARTSDTAFIFEFMADHPLIGPGFMTHDPALLIFDNSYYESLIEFGVIGCFFFVGFLLVMTFKPLRGLRTASDEDAPLLIAGLVAGLALLVGMVTFDALKFAQFLPTVLIVNGLAVGRAEALHRRGHEAASMAPLEYGATGRSPTRRRS